MAKNKGKKDPRKEPDPIEDTTDDKVEKNLPASKAAAGGVPTFTIPGGDPFVDGAARAYGGTMIDPTHRPLVLRADDPAALAVLGAYVLRAGGACDNARAKAASEAISAFEARKT